MSGSAKRARLRRLGVLDEQLVSVPFGRGGKDDGLAVRREARVRHELRAKSQALERRDRRRRPTPASEIGGGEEYRERRRRRRASGRAPAAPTRRASRRRCCSSSRRELRGRTRRRRRNGTAIRGFFSRQCRTIRSSAGEILRPVSGSSGGSSFRIAFIVSTAESFLERAHAREHLEEDRAEGKDVRPLVDVPPANLLGRHVADRAHDRSRLRAGGGRRRVRRGRLGREDLRETEVEDLDAPVARQEEVLRLQVAMDDPLFVRRGESLRDLDRDLDGSPLGEGARFRAGRGGLRPRGAP